MGFGSEEYWSVHFACTNAVSKSLVRGVSEGAVMPVHAEKLRHGIGILYLQQHMQKAERSYFQGSNMWQ